MHLWRLAQCSERDALRARMWNHLSVNFNDGVLSLVGTVVGGCIVLLGQRLSDKRAGRSAEDSDLRRLNREITLQGMAATEEFVVEVGRAIGDVRAGATRLQYEDIVTRAEQMDHVVRELRNRADVVLALSTRVPDSIISYEAMNVLSAWGLYLINSVDSEINRTEFDDAENFEALAARTESFFQTAREWIAGQRKILLSDPHGTGSESRPGL